MIATTTSPVSAINPFTVLLNQLLIVSPPRWKDVSNPQRALMPTRARQVQLISVATL